MMMIQSFRSFSSHSLSLSHSPFHFVLSLLTFFISLSFFLSSFLSHRHHPTHYYTPFFYDEKNILNGKFPLCSSIDWQSYQALTKNQLRQERERERERRKFRKRVDESDEKSFLWLTRERRNREKERERMKAMKNLLFPPREPQICLD